MDNQLGLRDAIPCVLVLFASAFPIRAAEQPPRDLAIAPGGLGDDFVALFWEKPDPNSNPTVTGYSVMRNGTEILTTTKLHAFVAGLTPGTSYTFAVRANGSGGRSANSNELAVTTRPAGQVFDVTTYGAKGDGSTDDWEAIKAAIAACTPGGKVFFPGGRTYISGTIRVMKSDIYIHFGDNAIVKANPAHMKEWTGAYFYKRNSGTNDANNMPTFFIIGYLPPRDSAGFKTESQKRTTTDVRIYGNGHIWGGSSTDQGSYVATSATQRAQRVLWYGLKLYGGGGWLNTIDYSDQVTIIDCKIGTPDPATDSDPWDGRDGWNPVFSNCIYFMGCDFATGDDCIALKTEKLTQDPQYNAALQYVEGTGSTHHIRITNCRFFHSSTSDGITFGSEITNGISDVFVQDCEGPKGILFKGSPDRDGYIRNIVVKDTRMPLSGFTYYWGYTTPGTAPNDMRDCLFENCQFVQAGGGTVSNQPLVNFTFINCTSSYSFNVSGPCENWRFYGCDAKMNSGAPAGSVVAASVPPDFQRLEIAFPCNQGLTRTDSPGSNQKKSSGFSIAPLHGDRAVVTGEPGPGTVLVTSLSGRLLARCDVPGGRGIVALPRHVPATGVVIVIQGKGPARWEGRVVILP